MSIWTVVAVLLCLFTLILIIAFSMQCFHRYTISEPTMQNRYTSSSHGSPLRGDLQNQFDDLSSDSESDLELL